MRNIIFLDIDGVMNCQDYFSLPKFDRRNRFHKPCVDALNELIVQSNADIVISSTWRSRGLEEMKKVWFINNMKGNIIGVTPRLDDQIRGIEIGQWLSDNDFKHINYCAIEQQMYMDRSKINNFVIIDDDSDMLYNQRNNFVHVKSWKGTDGFSNVHREQALKILNQTYIETNNSGD